MRADAGSPRPGTPGSLTLFALVGLGGLLGGLTRTGVLELAGPELDAQGLALINVLGSGLLGVLVGAATPGVTVWLRPFLGTGLLGGFTTYSAAMAAVAHLADGSGWAVAAGYLAASLVASVLAAGGGLALGLRLAVRGTTAVPDDGARRPGSNPGPGSTS